MEKNYILITGASSGIGKEIAIKLSEKHNIILSGRDSAKLELTKLECSNNTSQLIFSSDLSEVESLEENLKKVLTDNQVVVSHFVHCAGYMAMLPMKMNSLKAVNQTFSTNFTSAVLITKLLVNKRVNQDALESIVFISSNISNFAAKAFSLYAASKGALDSFMRCAAVELAPKVRVNSVLPGAVATEMTKSIFEDTEKIDRMEKTYPLGLGNTNDIYEAVNFLLFEKSRWITGQQLTVDGGRTIDITG